MNVGTAPIVPAVEALLEFAGEGAPEAPHHTLQWMRALRVGWAREAWADHIDCVDLLGPLPARHVAPGAVATWVAGDCGCPTRGDGSCAWPGANRPGCLAAPR